MGNDYVDITAQVEQELIEAEQLAKPHHFLNQGDGANVPDGYLETLREVWMRSRARTE
jgi:hypothetical protein